MADINEINDKPEKSEQNLSEKKGIGLFFGEAEHEFMESLGKEITIKILKESFILYRVDLKRTKTHSLYGEAKTKSWMPEIEIFGRINVEPGEVSTQVKGGVLKRKFGELTAHVYMSHLQELGLITIEESTPKFHYREGDFIAHKGQFYKISDSGMSNISNQFSYAGDRRFYLTIKAIETNEDVFKGR